MRFESARFKFSLRTYNDVQVGASWRWQSFDLSSHSLERMSGTMYTERGITGANCCADVSLAVDATQLIHRTRAEINSLPLGHLRNPYAASLQ